MSNRSRIRDHYLPPDREAFRRAEPPTGRVIVIAPTRAACETIELACGLHIETLLERRHGDDIRRLAAAGAGFGIVAGTGTGKTLAIRPIAESILDAGLRVGVVNREREATPETPRWNVVIVTTGIARRWFQDDLIAPHDTLVVDEIHQTSAELELCLALGKRVGCRFIWLSATVDPSFYARYLDSVEVLETSAFDAALAATVQVRQQTPLEFLDERFIRRIMREGRGVAVFLPTRAEVEAASRELGAQWPGLNAAFYHGGEPIRVLRPYLEGTVEKPFLLTMTQAGQSALNIRGLDTVVIYDACYANVVQRGRNVLQRQYLGPNEILQMAGRVHGRVSSGRVHILSDRDIEFYSLAPVPPVFQLAGDSERVALTAAALGVDLRDLDLPVPLDRRAYAAAVRRLADRGVVQEGRLTRYGRDVEAMPVDRPWGELLVHAEDPLVPFVAVASSVDSLHRMTREHPELSGVVVYGSDHLTAYNLYAEAVNHWGTVGEVYGLPRHVFDVGIDTWGEDRGVLVKAIEDMALGMASVYRTLERPLPATLPVAGRQVLARYQDLIARIMPFDLTLDGETADGDRVRLSDSSVCDRHGAIAGTVRYFADRFGVPRGAVEGTNVPFDLIKRYARRGEPRVEFREFRRGEGLVLVRVTDYHGFTLARDRQPLADPIPDDLLPAARDAMADAVIAGKSRHPNRPSIVRAATRIVEYWKRSGGTLGTAQPQVVHEQLVAQLQRVRSWSEFLETPLGLEPENFVPEGERDRLDALPDSAHVLGDRVPIEYRMEAGRGMAWLKLREKQASRLRAEHLPHLPMPLRFSVMRGRREVARAATLEELAVVLARLATRRRRREDGHRQGRRRR
jgi:ATP-dependent helicase HrpA